MRAKLPVRLAEALHAEAARRGMTLTDFVGEWASRETGVPYTTQEPLMAS